ncbi:hypothetical protein M5K25_004319 [Dendrobium thyrsiflorum]|uniref:DNA-directed RNA polymerase subunit n=1 Tax=Dendrobium thyrsiflorum TaxID=117978 RepID=A0ABD0VTW4_DENTH
MFFHITLERNMQLHPRHFGPHLRDKLVAKLMKDVEGTCSGRHGFVVAITSVEDIGKGLIREGTGFVTFPVKYQCVVFRPFKGEILEAVVTMVNKMGFFAEAGPVQIFVSNHLIPDDMEFQSEDVSNYTTSDGSVSSDLCWLCHILSCWRFLCTVSITMMAFSVSLLKKCNEEAKHGELDFAILGLPQCSRHLEHHPASFVGTDRGHHCGRDHPSLSNIRVAAPPYRSSPSLDGRPSIGSSFGSVTYDSPLGPTPSHLSQPLASPDLDSASEILVEKRIRKKRSPELETEYIHFVDANDITNNEDFFEDETEAITLGSLHDLNPELEPLNFNALVNPEPNPIKDIPWDKVYLNDINLISKETDLTLSTMELNSEDSDSIITSTGLTSHNSELIVDNPNEDNLDLGVSQLDLLPELYHDLIDPKSIELRVMTKHDHIENTNMSLEDRKLKLKDFELNWNKLESILGVAPLDLHLKESVLPDWAYHITLPTDLTENISPHFHVVPTPTLDTLTRLLSHIPTGDSLGYVIMVESDDPSSYHTSDSYILPATSLSFPVRDLLSPSWLTLLDLLTTPRRLSLTLARTTHGDALLAKDVFIAPPIPVPLAMKPLCPLIW